VVREYLSRFDKPEHEVYGVPEVRGVLAALDEMRREYERLERVLSATHTAHNETMGALADTERKLAEATRRVKHCGCAWCCLTVTDYDSLGEAHKQTCSHARALASRDQEDPRNGSADEPETVAREREDG
jgi:hypothetical protein